MSDVSRETRHAVRAYSPASFADDALLPGEIPPALPGYTSPDSLLLTVDQSAMRNLAERALAVGDGGLTAIGVTSLNHGDGATTVARSLAICLADSFGKRVVLVEANQRSPSLRRLYGLPEGPGLADVLARRLSLGGALQIAGEHRRILVLPAATLPAPNLQADALRSVLATLLGHADAVVVDLAPVLPYRDTATICGALDGVALVLRGGHATTAGGKMAVRALQNSGTQVLGAVLNREKPVVPRFMERLLARRRS